MDVHILLDVLTLCVVALLVIIFIVVQVTKKRKQLRATRSTETQTTNIVPDLDATIIKINSELSNLQDRLESMEQERLEKINAHRMSTAMLLSAVVAAVGAGEFELGRSGDLCLHMGAEQAVGLLSWDWWCWSRHVQLTPHE